MINWKVRFRQREFITAIISALLLLAQQIADIAGIKLPLEDTAIMNVVDSALFILVLMGIVVDPTTKGVSDSNRAIQYNKPYESKSIDDLIK